MKLNLMENLARFENVLSAQLLQGIEHQQPENPRYVLDRSGLSASGCGPFMLDKGDFWGANETTAQSFVLECVTGSLWLTLGNSLRQDVVLLPGKSYVSRPGDHVLVEALEESHLRITQAGGR